MSKVWARCFIAVGLTLFGAMSLGCAAGVPVRIFFHGIGVQWLTMFDTQPDKFTQNYGPLFDEVRCHSVGAGESAARLGVPLVGVPGDHHTVAALIAEGYQPIIF